MRLIKVLDLIEMGENYHCEFKRKFSTQKKIAKEMIAFANSGGGFILFGIDDDRKVIGIESEKSEADLIGDSANNYCEPPIDYNIEYKEIKGKEIVIVEIPESNKKPHRIQDYKNAININDALVSVRVNDKSVLASKEMIKIMINKSNGSTLKNYSIGVNEKIVFEYLDENETITVLQLKQIVNISGRKASRTLIKMVRANLLFLHKNENSQEYFSSK
ncbi:MAG: ATP-binding protein [Bacteroidetes bacterium]|nr:ATP-binding protein [Bacteroidota bacterium]MCH8325437.1 ATP-binding protein [Bacteroidota bacterium]